MPFYLTKPGRIKRPGFFYARNKTKDHDIFNCNMVDTGPANWN